jgi:tyrosine-protein kinase Etk/Wzc
MRDNAQCSNLATRYCASRAGYNHLGINKTDAAYENASTTAMHSYQVLPMANEQRLDTTVNKMIEQDPHLSDSEALPEKHPVCDGNSSPGFFPVEILTQIARNKRLIASITGGVMFLAVLCSLGLPTLYTATTRIMTPQQPQNSAAIMMNQLAGSALGGGSLASAASGLSLKNPNDTYIGLLNSRPVADALIARFQLLSLYRAEDMTTARKTLASNTKIASEKSGFISISVEDKDRKRAAELANAYTQELRALSKSIATTEASQRRLYYEGELKEAKDGVVAAEYAFQQIQQKKGLVQLDAQAKSLIASLAELQARVAAKKVELQALRSYSTELNPNVQLAKNQLGSLEAQVAQLKHSGNMSAYGDIGLQEVAGAGLEYLNAEHELQYRKVMFDLILKQYDAARMDEARDGAVIQIVETAVPPERKSSPHRALIALAFSLIGFLMACCWLALAEFLRERPQFTNTLKELRVAILSK